MEDNKELNVEDETKQPHIEQNNKGSSKDVDKLSKSKSSSSSSDSDKYKPKPKTIENIPYKRSSPPQSPMHQVMNVNSTLDTIMYGIQRMPRSSSMYRPSQASSGRLRYQYSNTKIRPYNNEMPQYPSSTPKGYSEAKQSSKSHHKNTSMHTYDHKRLNSGRCASSKPQRN